ncbi:hypothetical protein LLE49_13255 [Alicyclobacillus tolerans]|uniref:hypothetical protein n=1 Tax=Alicyclobacillus tolerans TaxID=90970 RepID=UPI001F24F400|nr:hypothetical protein [Alicyclobacillus tolerans]MCF8565686.1 hypothetical protein [Alicyclobacillus tolerans]
MNDDAIRYVPRWTTKEAAEHADISVPTVRKYAQILTRECNYEFTMMNGRRRFSDHDTTVFIEMKRLSDETGMNVEKVAQMVVARYGYARQDTEPLQTKPEANFEPDPKPEAALTPLPQDFDSLILQTSQQFWQEARKEIVEDIREVVREEVHGELRSEMDQLKQYLSEELESVQREVAASVQQEVATSVDKPNKPWWRFGR